MEPLTGDHLSPFPQSTDHLVLANPTAAVQKLRPIRSGSGRSPAVELQDNAENLGDGFPVPVESDMGTWGDELEDESSSSTDDDCDGDEHFEAEGADPVDRKRKRRSGREINFERVERFLQSLAMNVMEKQEQMHKLLLEMIEKREEDRRAREEAWKQQELGRVKRDKEIRAQETSRSLALISFIEKFVGHEIPIPPQPAPATPATPAPVVAPIQSPPLPLPLPVVPDYNNQGCMKEDGGADNGSQRNVMMIKENDAANRRWPEAEVKALIALRAASEHKFRAAGIAGSRGNIWGEISIAMYNMGYNRSAKKCKEKWENMNKYFKKSMVTERKRYSSSKTRPYFLELEMLQRNGVVSSGNGLKYTNNRNEAKSEKE